MIAHAKCSHRESCFRMTAVGIPLTSQCKHHYLEGMYWRVCNHPTMHHNGPGWPKSSSLGYPGSVSDDCQFDVILAPRYPGSGSFTFPYCQRDTCFRTSHSDIWIFLVTLWKHTYCCGSYDREVRVRCMKRKTHWVRIWVGKTPWLWACAMPRNSGLSQRASTRYICLVPYSLHFSCCEHCTNLSWMLASSPTTGASKPSSPKLNYKPHISWDLFLVSYWKNAGAMANCATSWTKQMQLKLCPSTDFMQLQKAAA